MVRKCSPSADVGGDLHNTKFAQRKILQYMEIRQGYSYHIKDEFFDKVQDKYLMSNKENGNYRPHFYAIQDKKNQALYWMIPISSQVEKYKDYYGTGIRKYWMSVMPLLVKIRVMAFFSRDSLHLIWQQYFMKSAYLMFSYMAVDF